MTDVADRDAMFFGDLVDLLCKLFAPLFVQSRDR